MEFAVVWSDEVARKYLPSMSNRLGEFMEHDGEAWRLYSISSSPQGCESRKEWLVHFGFEEVEVGELDRLQLKEGSLVQFARENYLTPVDMSQKWPRYAVL
jgi:hypothetical protein